MKFLNPLLLCAVSAELAFGSAPGLQDIGTDPVMKARAQRAAAQGLAEADLPPVPRGIVEPPPLPAPEIHPRDTRGYKASRRSRHGRKGTVKKGRGAPKSGKATPRKRRR
ncbi:MAG: hypothetical protein U0P81_06880 [Holophagaceae bacterium]